MWRVGEGGIRVTNRDGSVYSLPAGCVVDEVPERYEGRLELVEPPKRLGGYADKAIRPAEDKGAG